MIDLLVHYVCFVILIILGSVMLYIYNICTNGFKLISYTAYYTPLLCKSWFHIHSICMVCGLWMHRMRVFAYKVAEILFSFLVWWKDHGNEDPTVSPVAAVKRKTINQQTINCTLTSSTRYSGLAKAYNVYAIQSLVFACIRLGCAWYVIDLHQTH